MMPTWDRTRLIELTGLLCDERITDAEFAELSQLLEEHGDARSLYQVCIATHLRIEQAGAEVLGVPTLARSASEESTPHAPREAGHHAERDGYYPHSTFRISVIAAVVAFIAIGVLAYTFWSDPAAPTMVQQTPVSVPAAKIVTLTDAKWLGVDSHVGDTLIAGQQLLLQSGSVEITFNGQARVIMSGPAELTIVDAAACRLATGRLTAQVPEPAKGFKVHTPDGTVTDLGTEFGVYVKTGLEIPDSNEPLEQIEPTAPQRGGKESPVTEVHVFKGKVDVAPGDQLAQASTNQKSKTISAGEAVTISENKVQPLPAADPFKFAIEKLNGKPRQLLLVEDFETYELGMADKAIGPWIVQGLFRKGQSVFVIDPAAGIAQLLAERDLAIPHASLSPAIGQRVVKCVSSMELPKDTYPLLAREIDCREFARRCQVLVEFDLFTQGQWTEPSLAFAAEVGQAPGIALWQNSDAAAPKIPWLPLRWYRVRVLLDVADSSLGEVRVERSLWAGAEGWVRDSSYTPPVPKVEWKTPPRYVMFGFPVPPTAQSGGLYWLDNIRIEVISN